MIRTSLVLPAPLHQRLVWASKREGKPVAQVVREILTKVLTVKETAHIKKMYKALDKLDGIGEPGITDASISINETLYGKRGA